MTASAPGGSKTALFVSPHLDDVVFSCGGTLYRFSEAGWKTVLATVFTASVRHPDGFALACQLDKGLPPDVDYMAIRRQEDRQAAAISAVSEVLWLDFCEAPHRGYHSAGELFSGVHADDQIHQEVAASLKTIVDQHQPQLTFLPQGLGDHVDHHQVIRASRAIPRLCGNICWYRDLPYAIRHPDAVPLEVPATRIVPVDITSTLETKLNAVSCYTSQLGFQFGSEQRMREMLCSFALREGRSHPGGPAAEIFLSSSEAVDRFLRQLQ